MANCLTLPGFVLTQKHWICVSENCSMLMIQPLLPTTQLMCSKLWIVSPQQLLCLVLKSTFPRPSCSNSLLQRPLDYQRPLLSMMNHWRQPSLSLTVTNTTSANLEVERRIQPATKAYGTLQKRLWSCHDISTKTKVKVYSISVILACSIPSSAPLFTIDISWLWQDSSFPSYAPSST